MLPTASLVMGKKKLARSCETWRDWIGTTMLFLPVVKKPQATQVAHGLPISRASELRLVEDWLHLLEEPFALGLVADFQVLDADVSTVRLSKF